MKLTKSQYNHILLQYVELVTDNMTYEELYQFTYEQMEQCIREYYPTPDELLKEIASEYSQELVDDLLETVKKPL
jgi:hypothetical protein